MNMTDPIDTVDTIETFATVRFWKEAEYGSMRIGNTRVSLDSVYFHYIGGGSPEMIAEKFPGLPLSDIYGTIAYILENRKEVEEYIRQSQIHAEKMRMLVEEKLGKRNVELKKKVLARNEERLAALRP